MSQFLKRLLKYFLYFVTGSAILTVGLAAYLIWFQPPFYFPKPTGQHGIGVKMYHWIDSKRQEILNDDPAHPNREIMVNIWYPSKRLKCFDEQARMTQPEKPTTPWAPDLVDYFKKNKTNYWILCGLSRPIYSYAQPESSLASAMPCYPVIIFSHGWGVTRDGYTAQCEELASHGYIVVGISHTYDTSVVKFPDGRIADGTQSMEQRSANKSFMEMEKQESQDIERWISDVHFVLDQLEQLGCNKDSIFYQRFDQKNIGIVGHSFGGGVAAQICRRDQRVKAGVALDGFLHGPDATKKFDKPFMFMLAEDLVKIYERSWTQDDWKKFGISSADEETLFRSKYLPAIEQLTQSIGHDAYTFVIKGASHLAFCDNALLKHAVIFSRFLDNLGTGSIDGFRATEIINTYLVNFFDKYLKGQPSELLDGCGKKYEEVEQLK